MADFGIGEGIAAAGIVVSIASAAAATAAAAQQAQAAQKADNYNAQVASNDAQVATWQRQQQDQEYATQSLLTQEEGAREASSLELRNGSIVAKNIAAAASSGLQITGSTADVITGSAANNELEVLNEQHRTAIQAYQDEIGASNASYNSLIQANRDSAEAGLDIMAGNNAATSGMFSEAGAATAGTSRILTSTNSAYQSGLFD